MAGNSSGKDIWLTIMRFNMNKSPSIVSETWFSSGKVVFELVQLYESGLSIVLKCEWSLCTSTSSEQFQWNANQTSPYDPRSNLFFSLYLNMVNNSKTLKYVHTCAYISNSFSQCNIYYSSFDVENTYAHFKKNDFRGPNESNHGSPQLFTVFVPNQTNKSLPYEVIFINGLLI